MEVFADKCPRCEVADYYSKYVNALSTTRRRIGLEEAFSANCMDWINVKTEDLSWRHCIGRLQQPTELGTPAQYRQIVDRAELLNTGSLGTTPHYHCTQTIVSKQSYHLASLDLHAHGHGGEKDASRNNAYCIAPKPNIIRLHGG